MKQSTPTEASRHENRASVQDLPIKVCDCDCHFGFPEGCSLHAENMAKSIGTNHQVGVKLFRVAELMDNRFVNVFHPVLHDIVNHHGFLYPLRLSYLMSVYF